MEELGNRCKGADWTKIAEVKNHQDINIPIFGNGDIDSPKKTLEYRNTYGGMEL